MRLLTRFGLLTLAVFFSVTFFVGLYRLAKGLGVAPTLYIVSSGLLVLAGAIGVVGCLLKSRRLEQQYKLALAAQQFTGNRFEAGVSKGWLSLISAMVLTALWGVYLVLSGSPTNHQALVLPAAFLLFSMLLLAAILSLFRNGKPALVMDTSALDHAWYGPIRWDQIQGIHLRTIKRGNSTQHALVLLVDKPGRYLTQEPWWRRVFTSAKRRDAASGVIEFPLTSLNKPSLLIHEAAVALRSRINPPPLGFWAPWLSMEAIGVQREIDAAYRRLDEIGQLIERDATSPDEIEYQVRQVTANIKRLQVAFDETYWKSASASSKRDRLLIIAIFGGVMLFFLLRVVMQML